MLAVEIGRMWRRGRGPCRGCRKCRWGCPVYALRSSNSLYGLLSSAAGGGLYPPQRGNLPRGTPRQYPPHVTVSNMRMLRGLTCACEGV